MSIDAIWSSKLSSYKSGESEASQISTGRINLFIGPNNSGKSRLLRALFSSNNEEIHVVIAKVLSETVCDLKILDFIRSTPQINSFKSEPFLKAIQGNILSIYAIKEVARSFTTLISEAIRDNYSIMGGGAETNAFNRLKGILNTTELRKETIEISNNFNAKIQQATDFKSHYIPILRGMRPLDGESDLFLDRTLTDYFSSDNSKKLNIITGFNLYQLLVRFLLGQPEDRQRVRAYEKILGNEFFGGAEVTLIPEYGKDTISVKIGDDDQFSIYDLGDGMQQVIIITSAAFLEQDNSIFYIEEPEACLHPGLLRKLALFLLNHTQHKYFATTHSNHLLDLAETDRRVKVHRVSKSGAKADASFIVRECTRDRELLAELGVLASSVYLANSTIWVEGITDRLYLSVFLRKYIETINDASKRNKLDGLLENFHYAFVEYQGGTLGHWSFDNASMEDGLNASFLCSSAFLVADGDIVDKGDRALILEQQLGMRLHILNCKEIENILPREIIIKAAKSIFSRKKKKTIEGLSPELLDGLTTKIENSQYGIGYLLDKALGLPGRGKNARKVFADASGTINDKVKFCLSCIDEMNSGEWEINTPIKELCDKIFDHVLSQNIG